MKSGRYFSIRSLSNPLFSMISRKNRALFIDFLNAFFFTTHMLPLASIHQYSLSEEKGCHYLLPMDNIGQVMPFSSRFVYTLFIPYLSFFIIYSSLILTNCGMHRHHRNLLCRRMETMNRWLRHLRQ